MIAQFDRWSCSRERRRYKKKRVEGRKVRFEGREARWIEMRMREGRTEGGGRRGWKLDQKTKFLKTPNTRRWGSLIMLSPQFSMNAAKEVLTRMESSSGRAQRPFRGAAYVRFLCAEFSPRGEGWEWYIYMISVILGVYQRTIYTCSMVVFTVEIFSKHRRNASKKQTKPVRCLLSMGAGAINTCRSLLPRRAGDRYEIGSLQLWG